MYYLVKVGNLYLYMVHGKVSLILKDKHGAEQYTDKAKAINDRNLVAEVVPGIALKVIEVTTAEKEI